MSKLIVNSLQVVELTVSESNVILKAVFMKQREGDPVQT